MDEPEKSQVLEMVDEICRERILEIWTSMLKGASATFEATLDMSLRTVGADDADLGT
jgi:hypothetical protein